MNSEHSVETYEHFLRDFHEFGKQFDKLAENLFNGPQLDQLSQSFLERHKSYIEKLYQNCLMANKTIPKDGDVLSQDYQIIAQKAFESEDETNKLSPDHTLASPTANTDAKLLLADLYRRASQASHLRVSWNKSRHKREDDRREPLDLARRALRLEPNNSQVIYWYMIALGWYLDPLVNPRERALVARLFKLTCERCIVLNPNLSLAYHLLGRYYYNVAKLSWLERSVAKNLLDCKLEGTFEQAEQSMKRAHKINPNWLPTGLWMARVLMAQKKPVEELMEWIDFGLKCNCRDPASELDRDELIELRSRLKLMN